VVGVWCQGCQRRWTGLPATGPRVASDGALGCQHPIVGRLMNGLLIVVQAGHAGFAGCRRDESTKTQRPHWWGFWPRFASCCDGKSACVVKSTQLLQRVLYFLFDQPELLATVYYW
ncbi:MAG: hypothetical protein P8L85_00760, partial [Rubripirellula sp.]|nr:hypothetical protein [Rubripirellula sp.]